MAYYKCSQFQRDNLGLKNKFLKRTSQYDSMSVKALPSKKRIQELMVFQAIAVKVHGMDNSHTMWSVWEKKKSVESYLFYEGLVP